MCVHLFIYLIWSNLEKNVILLTAWISSFVPSPSLNWYWGYYSSSWIKHIVLLGWSSKEVERGARVMECITHLFWFHVVGLMWVCITSDDLEGRKNAMINPYTQTFRPTQKDNFPKILMQVEYINNKQTSQPQTKHQWPCLANHAKKQSQRYTKKTLTRQEKNLRVVPFYICKKIMWYGTTTIASTETKDPNKHLNSKK